MIYIFGSLCDKFVALMINLAHLHFGSILWQFCRIKKNWGIRFVWHQDPWPRFLKMSFFCNPSFIYTNTEIRNWWTFLFSESVTEWIGDALWMSALSDGVNIIVPPHFTVHVCVLCWLFPSTLAAQPCLYQNIAGGVFVAYCPMDRGDCISITWSSGT